ncbi:MAG: GNAT family N-acetyltransferase [Candidatus Marinimicrobia bacterium]|nr:GNAT family N-acetyltransferase [Candidatus Neomarinimicrobiota bacterium]
MKNGLGEKMNFDLGIAYTRKPEIKDLESIYQYRNDSEVYNMLGGFSHGISRLDVKAWIEGSNNRENDHIWALADKKTDVCIGHLGLYKIDYRIGKAELGLAISREYWGKGIGLKSTENMLSYGFNELRLNRIETFNLMSNKKIISLKNKLGFKTEGTLREFQYRGGHHQDVVIMAILKKEYASQNSE